MEWSEAPVKGVEGHTGGVPLAVAAGEQYAGGSELRGFV